MARLDTDEFILFTESNRRKTVTTNIHISAELGLLYHALFGRHEEILGLAIFPIGNHGRHFFIRL